MLTNRQNIEGTFRLRPDQQKNPDVNIENPTHYQLEKKASFSLAKKRLGLAIKLAVCLVPAYFLYQAITTSIYSSIPVNWIPFELEKLDNYTNKNVVVKVRFTSSFYNDYFEEVLDQDRRFRIANAKRKLQVFELEFDRWAVEYPAGLTREYQWAHKLLKQLDYSKESFLVVLRPNESPVVSRSPTEALHKLVWNLEKSWTPGTYFMLALLTSCAAVWIGLTLD